MIYWFEAKQLDRATNFSTETEMIRNLLELGEPVAYYCSFDSKRVYHGLEGHLHYLGKIRNRYLKFIEFRLLVLWKVSMIILGGGHHLIMVNQDLARWMMLPGFLNRMTGRRHKFAIDIRTFPTSVKHEVTEMARFYRQFRYAERCFDGLSFITPFMAQTVLERYPDRPDRNVVCWSSGVNMQLFQAAKHDYSRPEKGVFRVFYHGGLSVSRGTLDLIKACQLLVQRGYPLKLYQFGKVVDRNLFDYIRDHHLEEWCILREALPQNEIPALIAQADLPVLPFPYFMPWRVSSPLKLMEYMAMGKRVLVSRMECFTDVFAGDESLVFYYDPAQAPIERTIADTIAGIIDATDLNGPCICLDQAIVHAEQFTWRKQAEKIRDWSQRLFSENQ